MKMGLDMGMGMLLCMDESDGAGRARQVGVTARWLARLVEKVSLLKSGCVPTGAVRFTACDVLPGGPQGEVSMGEE